MPVACCGGRISPDGATIHPCPRFTDSRQRARPRPEGSHTTPASLVPPRELALEARLDREGPVAPELLTELGKQTTMACPECHGPMWEIGDEAVRRFRCYLGHAVTAHELISASAAEVESALWSAVRALNDRAATLETLAAAAERAGNRDSAEAYGKRAGETRDHAELVRRFMLELARPV